MARRGASTTWRGVTVKCLDPHEGKSISFTVYAAGAYNLASVSRYVRAICKPTWFTGNSGRRQALADSRVVYASFVVKCGDPDFARVSPLLCTAPPTASTRSPATSRPCASNAGVPPRSMTAATSGADFVCEAVARCGGSCFLDGPRDGWGRLTAELRMTIGEMNLTNLTTASRRGCVLFSLFAICRPQSANPVFPTRRGTVGMPNGDQSVPRQLWSGWPCPPARF